MCIRDRGKAVKEVKAGKIEYRLDKTNIIHCPIGKVSFGADKLYENYVCLLYTSSCRTVFRSYDTHLSRLKIIFPQYHSLTRSQIGRAHV